MKHGCPVCGWPELDHSPRDASGAPSYEICPSCGYEFGYDDDRDGVTYEMARRRWVTGGMRWWSASRLAPAGWNAQEQLKRTGF
jgi:hypothetical protein